MKIKPIKLRIKDIKSFRPNVVTLFFIAIYLCLISNDDKS